MLDVYFRVNTPGVYFRKKSDIKSSLRRSKLFKIMNSILMLCFSVQNKFGKFTKPYGREFKFSWKYILHFGKPENYVLAQ